MRKSTIFAVILFLLVASFASAGSFFKPADSDEDGLGDACDDTPGEIPPTSTPSDRGCGCGQAPSLPSLPLLLVLVAILARARRRY